MPQLDISTFPSQIFWLVVTFLVLYVSMSTFILPVIRKTLEHRDARISEDLRSAEELNAEVQSMADGAASIIEAAQEKARQVLHVAMANTQAELDEREKKFEEKLNARIHQAESAIESQRSQAIQDIDQMVDEVGLLAAQRVSGVPVAYDDFGAGKVRLNAGDSA